MRGSFAPTVVGVLFVVVGSGCVESVGNLSGGGDAGAVGDASDGGPPDISQTAVSTDMASTLPKVLVLSGGVGDAQVLDVQQRLMATGAFSVVDTYDGTINVPSPTEVLAKYDAVLVFSSGSGFTGNGVGDQLAYYYDHGGRVVVASLANTSGVPMLHGRFAEPANGYVFIQPDVAESVPDSLGTIADVNSPLVADVHAFDAPVAARSTGVVINGGIVAAAWKSGRPLIVRGEVKGRRRVDLNFYPPAVGSAQLKLWTGDGAIIMRNALLYVP